MYTSHETSTLTKVCGNVYLAKQGWLAVKGSARIKAIKFIAALSRSWCGEVIVSFISVFRNT